MTTVAPTDAAGQRGTLTIEPRVVERIAAAAAGEVEHVGGAARRVLSIAIGSDDSAERPRVDAVVDGGSVAMQVQCSVAYPAPVAAVSERLRAHLRDRIDTLTGLTTRSIGITVVALTSADTVARPGRRELS